LSDLTLSMGVRMVSGGVRTLSIERPDAVKWRPDDVIWRPDSVKMVPEAVFSFKSGVEQNTT
jgi:hypothetical protein